MSKKILSVFLALIMCLGCCSSAFAVQQVPECELKVSPYKGKVMVNFNLVDAIGFTSADITVKCSSDAVIKAEGKIGTDAAAVTYKGNRYNDFALSDNLQDSKKILFGFYFLYELWEQEKWDDKGLDVNAENFNAYNIVYTLAEGKTFEDVKDCFSIEIRSFSMNGTKFTPELKVVYSEDEAEEPLYRGETYGLLEIVPDGDKVVARLNLEKFYGYQSGFFTVKCNSDAVKSADFRVGSDSEKLVDKESENYVKYTTDSTDIKAINIEFGFSDKLWSQDKWDEVNVNINAEDFHAFEIVYTLNEGKNIKDLKDCFSVECSNCKVNDKEYKPDFKINFADAEEKPVIPDGKYTGLFVYEENGNVVADLNLVNLFGLESANFTITCSSDAVVSAEGDYGADALNIKNKHGDQYFGLAVNDADPGNILSGFYFKEKLFTQDKWDAEEYDVNAANFNAVKITYKLAEGKTFDDVKDSFGLICTSCKLNSEDYTPEIKIICAGDQQQETEIPEDACVKLVVSEKDGKIVADLNLVNLFGFESANVDIKCNSDRLIKSSSVSGTDAFYLIEKYGESFYMNAFNDREPDHIRTGFCFRENLWPQEKWDARNDDINAADFNVAETRYTFSEGTTLKDVVGCFSIECTSFKVNRADYTPEVKIIYEGDQQQRPEIPEEACVKLVVSEKDGKIVADLNLVNLFGFESANVDIKCNSDRLIKSSSVSGTDAFYLIEKYGESFYMDAFNDREPDHIRTGFCFRENLWPQEKWDARNDDINAADFNVAETRYTFSEGTTLKDIAGCFSIECTSFKVNRADYTPKVKIIYEGLKEETDGYVKFEIKPENDSIVAYMNLVDLIGCMNGDYSLYFDPDVIAEVKAELGTDASVLENGSEFMGEINLLNPGQIRIGFAFSDELFEQPYWDENDIDINADDFNVCKFTFIPAEGKTIEDVIDTCSLVHEESNFVSVEVHVSAMPVKENVVDATCTEPGHYEEVVYCKDCDMELSRTLVEVPAKGHDMVTVEASVPTCTTAGNNEYYHCTVCGKYFKDADGKTETTVDAEVLPALGHKTETRKENIKDATCTEDGSYDEVVYCTVCNKVISRKTVAVKATGHQWSEWTVKNEPTFIKEGLKERTCKACGKTETMKIDKLVGDQEIKNEDKGASIVFEEDTIDKKVDLNIRQSKEEKTLVIAEKEKKDQVSRVVNITLTDANNKKVEPSGLVLVSIPLPAGYAPETTAVYFVSEKDGKLENVNFYVKDNMICFETSHFSPYLIVDEGVKIMFGDVDGNKEITSSDARMALRMSVGLEYGLTDRQTASADVDRSHDITSSDARSILRASVGLEKIG